MATGTISKLSIRIDLPNGTRFGPGKAALLQAIDKHRAIAKAASALGMSYPRALKLIEQMNASFKAPLVETQHGGPGGGGAVLTPTGQSILMLYDAVAKRAADGTQKALSSFSKLARGPKD